MKKGQVYILAAIILCLAIFGVVAIANKAQKKGGKTNFESLSENYVAESAKLINSIITNPSADVGDSFKSFSALFTAYSKTRNPEFGLIYAFNYKGNFYLGNFLKQPILLSTTCTGAIEQSVNGCYEAVDASITFEGLNLGIGGIDQALIGGCTISQPGTKTNIALAIGANCYPFAIPLNQPSVIIVSFESKGEERKVFMEGEFVEGGAAPPTTFSDFCLTKSPPCPTGCKPGGAGCVVDCSAAYESNPDGCNNDAECEWNPNSNNCQQRGGAA
ncbi:hypothetical protein HY643_00715 [Candidatus Woesearchaeota archaeon]|nr:hypothetical protein [Candidatus Woesearchaeota archaeon]